jgi:hypothetical protein
MRTRDRWVLLTLSLLAIAIIAVRARRARVPTAERASVPEVRARHPPRFSTASAPLFREPPARAASSARRLSDADEALLDPELGLETGELTMPAGARYVLRMERRVIEPGEPFHAVLAVTDQAGRPLASTLVATELLDAATGERQLDGAWTTVAAGLGWDLTWRTGEGEPPGHGDRRVEITVAVAGHQQRVTGHFRLYYATPVHPTGRVEERVEPGALLVDAELTAKESWSCQLSANLHDEHGRPLEHTTWSGTVGPGRTTVSLAFAADLLQQAGFAGGVLMVRQFGGVCSRLNGEGVEGESLPLETVPILHITTRPYRTDELVALGPP